MKWSSKVLLLQLTFICGFKLSNICKGDASKVDIKFLEKHQIIKEAEMKLKIDLNCDLGEAFGNYTFGGDQHILPLITSANIACGYHAGDEDVMNETVQLAKK